jgi:hypothetical protein
MSGAHNLNLTIPTIGQGNFEIMQLTGHARLSDQPSAKNSSSTLRAVGLRLGNNRIPGNNYDGRKRIRHWFMALAIC